MDTSCQDCRPCLECGQSGTEGEPLVSRILPPGAVYHPAGITAYDTNVGGYNGDPVPAYVARPSEGGPHPGLLLVHGIHGYEEHMKDMARRYAALGLRRHRSGPVQPGRVLWPWWRKPTSASARDALNARPNAQTIGDLQGGLELPAGQPSRNPSASDWSGFAPVGGWGWCSPAAERDWTFS